MILIKNNAVNLLLNGDVSMMLAYPVKQLTWRVTPHLDERPLKCKSSKIYTCSQKLLLTCKFGSEDKQTKMMQV